MLDPRIVTAGADREPADTVNCGSLIEPGLDVPDDDLLDAMCDAALADLAFASG